MGKIRKHSRHIFWNDADIEKLKQHYFEKTLQELLDIFPGRKISSIHGKAQSIGLKRKTKPKMTREEYLKSKRDFMARRRAKNLDGARKYQRDFHAKNRDKRTAKMRSYYARRFFWGRAMKLKGDGRATTADVSRLWKAQKGRCGLTGRKLTREAELDHILPKARGGNDSKENLRWVCEEANMAKRHLTDDEFFSLCREVVEKLMKEPNK